MANITGTAGNDTITPGFVSPGVVGGSVTEGADSVLGLAGNDGLAGGDGNDTLDGGANNDSVDGGAGEDVVVLTGTWRDYDIIDTGPDFSTRLIDRRPGAPDGIDDVIRVEIFLFADGPRDPFEVPFEPDVSLGETLSGNPGWITYGYGGADSIVGTTGSERLDGGDGADTLLGAGGNDTLIGGSGKDTLRGEAGDDSLDGGLLADSLAGGAGNDTYVFGTGDTITELAGEGTDTVQTAATAALGAELEALVLTGNAAADGTGNAEANTLTGNGAANRLVGLAGADTLVGGNGSDTLVGGDGADVLEGGRDLDVFAYASASEGSDTILGFRAADDGFEIDASGFGGGLVAGADLAATGQFVANRSGRASAPDGTGQFIFETDTDILRWDADGRGAGAAVIIATIDGQAPTAADFTVIA